MKSDSELLEKIRTLVVGLRGGHADEVDVQIHRSVVTLTGHLPSALEEWNLRDAIGGMPDVERVVALVTRPLAGNTASPSVTKSKALASSRRARSSLQRR